MTCHWANCVVPPSPLEGVSFSTDGGLWGNTHIAHCEGSSRKLSGN